MESSKFHQSFLICFLVLFLVGAGVTAGPIGPWHDDPSVTDNPGETVAGRVQPGRMAKDVGDPVDFDAALAAGADYLQGMQADVTEDNAGNGTDGVDETPDDPDDAGWDWRVTSPPAPFSHSTAASPTNIYGATAQGLYFAYLETGNAGYFTALKDYADRAVAAGPDTIRTGADMKMLLLFNDLYSAEVAATTVYADAAKAKYDGRITLYGSATALAEYIRDARAGQGYENGIIAWDIGVYAVAAQMLYERYGGTYDQDADDIAEVLWQDSFNDTPGYFDIVDDAGFDPTYADLNFYWYNLGVTGLIDAFSASGSHSAEIPGLVQRMFDSQFGHGGISFSYGANTDDEDWQSTGYAAITLGNLDQAAYQSALNRMGYWIGATQDAASGGWVYSTGNHYPETCGEVTAGLYFTTNDITDVVVDDDFTSQADVDAYNAANSTNYVWGYTAFATIGEAMGAVTGSTIHVAAGIYYETLNITLDNLSIIGEDRATVIIDATGLATNNAGIYVAANNVTLQSFTLIGTVGNSLPRYGVKFADVTDGLLEDVEIRNIYRTGVDMLGTSGVTVNDVYAHSNGGNGLQCGDAHDITFSNITTHDNAWGGIGIFTYGRYTPLGTDGIVITGTNSLGEVTGGVSPLYLEQGNYSDPGNPEPITYSTNPADGADVTFQIADFTHTLHGNSDNDNVYIRFYPSLGDAQAAAAGAVSHILDDRYIVEIDGTNLYVPANLGGIQAAVDAATAGYLINIDAGTFEEQVVIEKDISLLGAGTGSTVLQSPATLTAFFATSNNNYPIILVQNTAAPVIDGMTIDGLGRGNANYRFVGIGFWNAGGTVSNAHITGIVNTPFSGQQHGNGIYSYNNTGGPYTINVTGVSVDMFQKNGLTLLGEGLTVNISGCTVTGIGATTITAQNGIQLGYGSGGTITDCAIDGIAWDTAGSWIASGMLLYQGTTVDISDCEITNSQANVIYQETNGSVTGLTVATGGVVNEEGISIRDYGAVKAGADSRYVEAMPMVEAYDGNAATKAAPTTVTIDASRLLGVQEPGSYGIAAWSLGDDAHVVVTNSQIKGWEIGLVAYESGSAVDLQVAASNVSSNLFGMWTNAALPQLVEENYWGSYDGPIDSGGTQEASIGNCFPALDMINLVAESYGPLGDSVQGLADYCPWVSSAVEFDTYSIVHHCPGTIAFDVRVSAAVQALEGANVALEYPADLSFASATVASANYQLLPISTSADGVGYDTVFIPFIVKTGWQDGPATLYTVQMTAENDICSADQLTMISADLRDTANATISTPLPPAIDVVVDCADPVFTTTTADGGYYNVPPMLAIAASDNCDLSAIYYVVDDACNTGTWQSITTGMTGTSYTNNWSLPQAVFDALTEDQHCIRFKVLDDAGRGNVDTCTFEWCFTKDVTAPPPPTDLTALPRHNKVALNWTNASSDFDHTVVMRTDWNAAGHGYPEYGSVNGTAEGPYPVDTTTGDLIVATTGETWDDTDDLSNATRDIYHYAAFTVDAAGNVSATGAQARSTSYWLGDVAGSGGFGAYDGFVYAEDLNPLTIVYGSAEGDANWNSEMDFGPSSPGGAKDIPIPDDSVNFEDGILFAINFDAVSPYLKAAPIFEDQSVTGPLAIELRPIDGEENSYEVWLVNNDGSVKGIHTVVETGADVRLAAHGLSDPMKATEERIFSKVMSGEGTVTFDVMVLGKNRTIRGSGPLVTLTFEQSDEAPSVNLATASVRDLQNTELATELHQGPGTPTLPTAYELAQNSPNPFNPSTVIAYALAQPGRVRLDVFNVLGQRVTTLVDRYEEAGSYSVTWNGRDEAGRTVSTGLYLYRIQVNDFVQTRKMLLLK